MSQTSGPKIYAVLTGDVISSSDMDAGRLGAVRDAIQRAAGQFSNDYKASVEARLDTDLDMYRGDGWQLLLTEHALALRMAAFIQADIYSREDAQTRIAIGLGTVDHLDRDRVSLSTGEAFTLSGRALESMTGYSDLTAALPERAGLLKPWVPASLQACSHIIRGWTRRQAQIAALALLYPKATQDELAGKLDPPVTKQAVTAALHGAGWRGVLASLDAFEETDWTALLKHATVA